MSDRPQGNAELERTVRLIAERVADGAIDFNDLLRVLAPATYSGTSIEPVPAVAQITNRQREALERLPQVFGQVVPQERRTLQPAEVSALVEEKETLAELKKLYESRQEGIRHTIFNHLDLEVEAALGEGQEPPPRCKDGHYAAKGEVRATPTAGKKFTREVRTGQPVLDVDELRRVVDDPEVEFDHDDFLEMTTQTRVVDENKVMLALKRNPNLIHAVRRATKMGDPTAALYLRNNS